VADTLKQIQQSYGNPENPSKEIISHSLILKWMKEEDINTLGALYACLLKQNYTNRITPPLKFKEYKTFFLNFYKRCLIENNISNDPDSYLMSRYDAARDMSNWILSLQDDKKISKKELEDVMAETKDLLAKLYIKGNKDFRTCLITAVFEHIYTDKRIMHYFKDWETDAVLEEAYKLSCIYTKKLKEKI